MKKRLCLLPLLLLCLLAACGAPGTEPGITGELGQRYDPRYLRYQNGIFRAIAYPRGQDYLRWPATAAGLHAVTGRLIVVYTHQETGEQFWLESHVLNDLQACMVRERDMPTLTWMTHAGTPETRCEFLLPTDGGPTYALALCSDTLTEKKLLSLARQVEVWLPGERSSQSYSCVDARPRPIRAGPPWDTDGDLMPDRDGKLAFRLRSSGLLLYDGSWRMQRLDGGYWRDTDYRGHDGITCADYQLYGALYLELPPGEYRLLVACHDEEYLFTEIPYAFRVLR